ncbi:unnamed protein product [Rotaria sordida]|uniref:Uncharacterized protein n=2 Tax=Rotaria sordida TaxID=392033 RepID=A0A815HQS4_9BILA|nr:unnamed protein product [Rotaria sordida]
MFFTDIPTIVYNYSDVRVPCGLAIELIILFNQNSGYGGLKLNIFDFNNVIDNNSARYLGVHKIEEIRDYERLTGTNILVEESDFKIESLNIITANIKCVC